MEIHIYSVKSEYTVKVYRVKQVIFMTSIKRAKPLDTLLGILKISAFCWKIQQRASGPGEKAGEVR